MPSRGSSQPDCGCGCSRSLVPVKQVEVRPLRKGWIDYDSETPIRFILLDKWRKHVQWKKKCRGIILRMGIMRQYIQVATFFSAWKQVHTVYKSRAQRENERRVSDACCEKERGERADDGGGAL